MKTFVILGLSILSFLISGFKTIFLVGHDIGTQVAYSYAAAHPTEVKKLAVMELTIPGFAPPGRAPIWWGGIFHQDIQTYLKPLYKEKR